MKQRTSLVKVHCNCYVLKGLGGRKVSADLYGTRQGVEENRSLQLQVVKKEILSGLSDLCIRRSCIRVVSLGYDFEYLKNRKRS